MIAVPAHGPKGDHVVGPDWATAWARGTTCPSPASGVIAKLNTRSDMMSISKRVTVRGDGFSTALFLDEPVNVSKT